MIKDSTMINNGDNEDIDESDVRVDVDDEDLVNGGDDVLTVVMSGLTLMMKTLLTVVAGVEIASPAPRAAWRAGA